MNALFKKRQSSFLLKLLIFTIVLFAVHSYLLHYLVDITLFFPLWQVYAFHFVVTLIIYSIINYKHSAGKKEIFNMFLASSMVKMIMAMLFLLPLLLHEAENKIPDVLNFFIPYFCLLAFEVYFITNLLNNE